jgi:DNA mismatch endonuclease, patch repair protein
MRANRRRDTGPEMALRTLLHRSGLRYRVDYRVGTGRSAPRPDIAFTRARVAVFVDGCFWHSCPKHATMPKANRDFWESKLERNVERDRENDAALEAMGWTVIRIWEHESAETAAACIIAALRSADRAPLPESDRTCPTHEKAHTPPRFSLPNGVSREKRGGD